MKSNFYRALVKKLYIGLHGFVGGIVCGRGSFADHF
jgi:hypothetical protein